MGIVSAEVSSGWLIAGGVVLVLNAIAVIAYPAFMFRSFVRGRHESAELPEERKAFASIHALSFAGDDEFALTGLHLRLFSDIRHSPYRVTRVAHGAHGGLPTKVFDLEVAGGYGGMEDGTFFRRELCVLVEVPFTVPDLLLQPRRGRLLDRLTAAKPGCRTGLRTLPSHFVCASDGRSLDRLLDLGVDDWLSDRGRGVRIEAADGVLVGSRNWVPKSWGFLNRLFGTGSNVPPLEETREFVDLIRVAAPP